jgi:spore coat protein H
MKISCTRIFAASSVALAVFIAGGILRAQNPRAVKPKIPVATVLPAPQNLGKKEKHHKHADAFFAGPVVHLEFTFKPSDWEDLKKDNRRYAECTMIETATDGKKTEYKHVAVKLKGAAGSTQGPDQKPGLTVSLDKFKGSERFHGMEKFHLNNGAQDGSLLNEFIGGEMSRAAGVPASRCTHVVVKWNGRDTGLYLFKESFTKDFLSYFYEKTDGSLYDGHFISEIDGDLEKQQGGDKADKRDLKALAAACKEGDPKVRWQKLAERLDLNEYLRCLAMEIILTHWDGYNFNRNNYRVYFDPKSGKANFFIHGIDQIYGEPNWPLVRDPGSLVGQAVWSNPDWKAHYSKVVKAIYENVLKPVDWEARISAQGQKIMEGLARANPQWAKDYQGQIGGARGRVAARLASIGKQLGDMPKPIEWVNNAHKLGPKQWNAQGGGVLDEQNVDGKACLHIRADDAAAASWRRSVVLEPGRYRFEAMVKCAGVEGGDASGDGAGLRISGGTRKGVNGLTGNAAWQKIAFEFDGGGEAVLVVEVRSAKGEAWFQTESLQLVRVK